MQLFQQQMLQNSFQYQIQIAQMLGINPTTDENEHETNKIEVWVRLVSLWQISMATVATIATPAIFIYSNKKKPCFEL